MARPAIAIALPRDERRPSSNALARGGPRADRSCERPEELEALLAARTDVAVAILDGESDFDQSLE